MLLKKYKPTFFLKLVFYVKGITLYKLHYDMQVDKNSDIIIINITNCISIVEFHTYTKKLPTEKSANYLKNQVLL